MTPDFWLVAALSGVTSSGRADFWKVSTKYRQIDGV